MFKSWFFEETTDRVQSVVEDARIHSITCGTFDYIFKNVFNMVKPSQTIIDAAMYYLGTIFPSQNWGYIKMALETLMVLYRAKWLDSEQRIALRVKLEEMFSLYEVQPGRNTSTLYALRCCYVPQFVDILRLQFLFSGLKSSTSGYWGLE